MDKAKVDKIIEERKKEAKMAEKRAMEERKNKGATCYYSECYGQMMAFELAARMIEQEVQNGN